MGILIDCRNKSAEEIVRRFWQGFVLFRVLRWTGCIACLFCLLSFVWDEHGTLRIFLLLLVYFGYLYALRLLQSLRFLSLNPILTRECDAVKFAEVSRLIQMRLGRRTSGMAALNYALGLYWSGRFSEVSLDNVELKGKNLQGHLLLRSLDFNCRMQRSDYAGARYVRQGTAAYVQKMKSSSAAAKSGKQVLARMDAALALAEQDWEELRALQESLYAQSVTNLQRVTAAFSLAKADLAQGNRENAVARLTYVAEHGGTLFVAQDARKLLDTTEENK